LSLSLYDASIPAYVQGLKNLTHLLDKAETYAGEAGIDLSTFLEANLGHGMAAFPRQIQFCSDTAKSAAARLSGATPPSMPDTETTFPELRERIAKTLAYVESVRREDIDGHEDREVVLKFPNGSMTFTAQNFLTTFSLPNFYFHLTVAYALLRANGVPLGKMDYLAGAQPAS
jgi:hypothetical protein